jgi:hypothetical protein
MRRVFSDMKHSDLHKMAFKVRVHKIYFMQRTHEAFSDELNNNVY